MLSFFKNRSNNKLLSFLNKADDNYMLMYQHRNIDYFKDYCGDKLAIKLMDILSDDPDYQVGIAKYRHRSWTVMEKDGFFYAYQKDSVHDSITLKGALSIPLGDDAHEIWKVDESDDKCHYTVVDIMPRKEFQLC